jgi:indole-3-glycerol phosphate synthase
VILDRIVQHKYEEVVRLKKERPESDLRARIGDVPEPYDFREAIAVGDCSIIAEVKKRSPSKGEMRNLFDPPAIASIYEKNGAAALSVLTDQEFFGGEAADLINIRAAVSLPLLRKDFIVDPYQIFETRVIGGDAVLLIARILEQAALADFKELAESLGLCPLVEVHNRDDLDKAVNAGATVIGINNRNLDTFTTDITVSIDLAAHVPEGRIVVSESGIATRTDINRLRGAGIRAFLVGEALMTAEDMGAKLRELSGGEDNDDRS